MLGLYSGFLNDLGACLYKKNRELKNGLKLKDYLDVAWEALEGAGSEKALGENCFMVWKTDGTNWICLSDEDKGLKAESEMASQLSQVAVHGKTTVIEPPDIQKWLKCTPVGCFATFIPFSIKENAGNECSHIAVFLGKKKEYDSLTRHDRSDITQLLSMFLCSAADHAKSVFEQWQQAFYCSSRSAVTERSMRLADISDNFLPTDQIDFIKALRNDCALGLKIVPPKTSPSENLTLELMNDDTGLFSELVSVRCSIWKKFNEGKAVPPDLIEKAWVQFKDKSSHIFDPGYFPSPPEPIVFRIPNSSGTMDDKINPLGENLRKCSSKNVLQIERIRTVLFALHHGAVWQEDITSGETISCLDDLIRNCSKDISNDLKLLLTEFLDAWQDGVPGKLPITTDWLVVWFGQRILIVSDIWPESPPDFTPAERALHYKHLSTFYLYCTHIVRWFGESDRMKFCDVGGGNESFMESFLYILSRYAHSRLGIERHIPFYDVLYEMWLAEAVLYTVRDSYRDHLHHVINVYLIGILIFDAGVMDSIIGTGVDKMEWERNWMIAALFHDVGYIAKLGDDVVKRLAFLERAPILKQFTAIVKDGVRGAYRQFDESFKELNGSIWQPGSSLDHGQVSSVFIRFLNEVDREDEIQVPNKEWVDKIKMALHAVETHNLPNRHVTINPTENPMSFLLIMCDHLQEWDRPRFDPKKIRRAVSTLVHFPRDNGPERFQLIRWLETDLIWSNNKIAMQYPGEKVRIKMVHADASKQNFEPAINWAANTGDLQAVNCSKWPDKFMIELVSSHILSEELNKDGGIFEFDLLADYVRKFPNCSMLIPWVDDSRAGTRWFKYERKVEKDHSPEETFIWTFAKRSFFERTIRKKMPAGLYSSYVEWKVQRLRQSRIHMAKGNP